ncbi:hypothetical protein BJX99DRAFT_258441 [Aspergillus californicus]
MASRLPSAVVCGPQTTPPPQQCLEHLRSRLLNDPELKLLLEATLELPSLLSRLQGNDENLHQLSALPLSHFRNWALDTGHVVAFDVPETLPNILLSPLTVLIHIVQYIEYLDSLASDNEDVHNRVRAAGITGHSGFQGLCTGSLSATALACSPTRAEIGQNAARALNLAVCIGAYADIAQNGSRDSDSSVGCAVARWRVNSNRAELEEVLSRFPEAYVSVDLDECSATITARETDLPALRAELAGKSISFANLQLKGRYHSKGNESSLEKLLQFCESEPSLRFPALSELGRSDTGNSPQLHETCLRSILTERANWHLAISETAKTLSSALPNGADSAVILELGLVGCIPPSLAASSQLRIIRADAIRERQKEQPHKYSYPDQCIAIVGAACKYPGAESLDELWNLVSTAQSRHGQVPRGRYYHAADLRRSREGHRREKGKANGNFISGAEYFDCAFFGISPREAMYMDPQQRVALQVAYRAIESSGYFAPLQEHRATDVGCYLGVGGSDYEHLVNAHSPTAFSFIGTSRAFVSGRISHFFKWTGPSISIDTACSSSAIAVHQACRAILAGECSMALAGGVSIMCSPCTHGNLATANFLNSTDTPCRPFDVGANGYSRGEGCGMVVLKKLSAAMADADQVLGVIAATATNQSDGSSLITVPVSASQVSLYRQALSRAGMTPGYISYVEAHGTGTPRGDPIEWRSINEVFGRDGNSRVHVGSIKANIGHTEAASGVAGVLKLLTMIHHQQLPPQANFTGFNAAIPQDELRLLAIPRKSLRWDTGFRSACVNNYGAAGNNTVVIVCQAPSGATTAAESTGRSEGKLARYPIRICAHSTASLHKSCAAIAQLIATKRPALPDVSFSLARTQNPRLSHHVIFGASSLVELQHILESPSKLNANLHIVSGCKPVVLVFGGQTGMTVHLSRAAYDMSCLLRKHLDHCDFLLREMGLPSVFPAIFSDAPISNVILLHCAFFAVQYACAMAWLDSGLLVQRVIGHSFGQFTAMCVSGVITLCDALKLVSGRAKLIESEWGSEKGAMLSVKADRQAVLSLTESETSVDIEVACFNAVASHVLVGSEAVIERLIAGAGRVKMRRLNTSHGFHSRYVDAVLDQYLQLAREVPYSAPNIPIETCSESRGWDIFTPELVAEHSRKPVYFVDAVHRIRERHGPCLWLEAGPGCKGVALAKKALGGLDNSDSFHGLQLGAGPDPMQSLVDTTVRLWKEGVSVSFWKHHPIESPTYDRIDLPGYQFEENSHWLPFPGGDRDFEKGDGALVRLADMSSPEPHVTRFEFNQLSPTIAEILRGREVLGGLLWPISLYLELISQAAALLTPGIPWEFQRVRFEDFEIQTSLGGKQIPGLGLRLKLVAACTWEWSLGPHATGKIMLEDQRAVPTIPASKLPRSPPSEATILSATGSIAYQILGNVASYDPCYQGIESVTMSEHEAIAHISTPQAARKWDNRESLDPILFDQFMLVAELHVLATCKRKRSEVFTCSGVREVIAHRCSAPAAGSSWTVHVRQSLVQGRFIHYDTYVYGSGAADSLAFVIRGARFVKVASHVLQRVVDQANGVGEDNQPTVQVDQRRPPGPILTIDPKANAWSTTAHLVYELTGFPSGQITAATGLAEIGLDSLATADLEHRLKERFGAGLTVDVSDMTGTFGALIETIQRQGSPRQTDDNASSLFSPMTVSSSPSTAGENIGIASDTMSKLCSTIAAYLGNGDVVHPNTQLQSLGLDSLVAIELESELHRKFGLHVNLMDMCDTVTPNELCNLLVQSNSGSHFVEQAPDHFAHARHQFSAYCQDTGFTGFFERVYPTQCALVLAYVTEAFAALGCDLSLLPPEAPLPDVHCLPKHSKVLAYYYNLLAQGGLVTQSPSIDTGFIRTSQPLERTDASSRHHEILESFPQHRAEHKLLHRTGAHLAACLSGHADPLRLLFSDNDNSSGTDSALLQDVYTNAPMFKTGTLLLSHLLPQVLASSSLPAGAEPIRIIELGAGTGGTTRFLIDQLLAHHIAFQYTFTDISPSLVSRARNTFRAYNCIEYTTMDVEQIPPEAFGQYDVVVSSNCIHATRDLRASCRALHGLLRPKGMLCLLELTRDLPWLDLTFGLLEGWWRFEDGREHVLACEERWKELLLQAGFGYVDWSDDGTALSGVYRLILALKR